MVFALSKNARLRFLNTVRQNALRIELTKCEKGFQQKNDGDYNTIDDDNDDNNSNDNDK